jgi:patatin-like phospholipase/acyl hydrolase
MSQVNILSLDGGGIRGVMTAEIVRRISEQSPDFVERTTLVAGTSTGGLIALALASGIKPSDIVKLYVKRGREIFDDSWWDDVKDVLGLIGADYDNKGLKRVLKDAFGETKMSGLKKKVAVAAFDALGRKGTGWCPKVFHNVEGPDSDGKQLVRDVALYTCSAPTYFPVADGYIDGGVYANNPSMVGLAQALDSRNESSALAGTKVEDIVLLSLGTGDNVNSIGAKNRNADWGLGQWAKPIIEIMMDGAVGIADYQCQRLLGDRYMRGNVTFDKYIKMDDVSKIDALVKYGAGNAVQFKCGTGGAVDLAGALAWLKKVKWAGA